MCGKNFIPLILGLNLTVFCYMFPKPKVRASKKHYDCAIVCGCSAYEDGSPSETLKTRVEEGVRLWKEKKVDVLIFSGAAVRNEFIEAEVMFEYAKQLGVSKDAILMEKQAVSTYHNLLYAKEIMEHHNLKDCAVVTNGFHLRKANHYARKFKLDYVMCEAKSPEFEHPFVSFLKTIVTNIHMYGKMFQGYY